MKKEISFVDCDLPSIGDTYILNCLMQLGEKYEVKHYFNPEEFNEKNKNLENIACIVSEMNFWGDGKSKGGKYIGFDFYENVKSKKKNLPMILNTILYTKNDEEVQMFIKEKLRSKDYFFEKTSLDCNQLTDLIEGSISE